MGGGVFGMGVVAWVEGGCWNTKRGGGGKVLSPKCQRKD